MFAHLPAWSRLLLVLVLVSQTILPVHAASAPSIAAPVEPAPAPAARPSAALTDRLTAALRHAQEAILQQARAVGLSNRQDVTTTLALTSTFAATFTSPLPTPTPTPVPARDARLTLAMQAAPAWVAVGETVTFTVTAANAGRELLAGLVLSDTLPAGLVYVAKSATGFAYAADAQRLTWRPASLAAGAAITGSFQARVQGLALGATVTNTVSAAAPGWAGPVMASATLDIVPPAADEAWADAAGGWLRSTDGRVLLQVPPAAVDKRVRFTYAVARDVPKPPAGLRFAFRLEAQEERGQAVRQFPAPLALTVAYDADQGTAAGLFYYDEAAGRWQSVPAEVERSRRQLWAALDHLTLFAITSGEDPVMPSGFPTIRGMQSDLFTGAATIGYDIALPPGAGGFTPRLSLQFNSRNRADSTGASSVLGAGWNLSVDSWVATGWFLAGSTTDKPTIWHIDGVSYTEANGTFREAPDWRITAGPNDTRDAYAPDGRRYHFEPAFVDTKDTDTFVTAKWLLSWVTDAVGNRITYHYAWPLPIDPAQVDDAYWNYVARIKTITVPTPPGDPDGTTLVQLYRHVWTGSENLFYLYQNPMTGISYNHAPDALQQTQIEFRYDPASRTDFPGQAPDDPCNPETVDRQYFYTDRLLRGIYVNQLRADLSGYDLVAAYKLEYDHWGNPTCHRSQRYALKSVAQCSGYANATWTGCLPATTYTNAEQGNDTGGWLSAADNNYGGHVTFAHTSSYGWAVTAKTVSDATTGQADTWSYSYSGEVHNTDGVTIGFTDVTETLPASLGAGHAVYHQFLPGDDTTDLGLRGRESVRRTTTNGVKLEEVARDWQGTTVGVYGGIKLVYLNWEEQRRYNQNATLYQAQRTQYYYDLDHQNNAQYGNPTHILEYSDAGGTLYRTRELWYYPKDSLATHQYLVHKPAQEKVWEGAIGTNCRSQMRNVYDTTGLSNYTTPPTHGLLREVWRAKVCDSANSADWIRTVAYGYDTWGNRTSETAPNTTTTTTEYDLIRHAYPLTVTVQPPAGQGATLTTFYRYYGVNAQSGGSGLFGQLKGVIDPNAALTLYTYDEHGRLREIRRPGVDSFSYAATEAYEYRDNTTPFRVTHALKDDTQPDNVTTASYLVDYTFYDGLGQVIQTQGEGATTSAYPVVSTRYNALGLVIAQTMPYPLTSGFSEYHAPDWNASQSALPRTQTTYDALGRVRVTTRPDNTTTEMRYDVEQSSSNPPDPDFSSPRQTTYVIDANGRFVRQAFDAFGQLRLVTEVNSTWPNWGAEHRTRYTYDVLDRLTQVEDVVGQPTRQTQIAYDLLGRKTSLTDPDMGPWSYAYDAAGNLTRQTDAKGQTACFYYDGLKRLKGKTYRSDINCPTSDPGYTGYAVKYYYDETTGGNKGLGRRTHMEDATSAAFWTYDLRGRVTQERRSIYGVGGGTFATALTYDSADRVLALTYPDGEIVTASYTAQGLPNGLSSPLAAYVASTSHDASGRVDLRTFGNTLRTDYEYFPWTTAGGRLKRISTGTTGSPQAIQDLRHYNSGTAAAGYDAVGNVLRIEDWKTGSPQTQTFGYDFLHRLTSAGATGGTTGNYTQYYAYTADGNLTLKNQAGDPAWLYGAQVSGCPAGTLTKPHALSQASGSYPGVYSYDCNGNVTTRVESGTTYAQTWDAENRLQGATVNGGSPAAFVYDSDGQRIKASWGSGDAATIAAYAGNIWEISSLYQESFSDGLAQGWTVGSGNWAVQSGKYQQSGTASNTNAYRALTQNRQLAYRWVATYSSGTNAGLYLFASAATGAERGNSYRIWQDATSVKVYENANNVATQRASFAAANTAGQTHSYQVLYHPQTGVLQVARDGIFLGAWTDTSPLTSGGYLSLRTDGATVQFDDMAVSEVVKYYYIGGQRVAMRRGGTLYYLHSDHLGSTSVASNGSAPTMVTDSRVQYYPYGGTRGGGSGLPTEYRFTGQRREPSIGLYDYGARFYEPRIGRFQAPDPIVPQPGDPQSLNRYAYVRNNPLRYIDPTGYAQACAEGDEGGGCGYGTPWWENQRARYQPFSIRNIRRGGMYGQGEVPLGDHMVSIYLPPTVRTYQNAEGLLPLYEPRYGLTTPTTYAPVHEVEDYWWGDEVPGKNAVQPNQWKRVTTQHRVELPNVQELIEGSGKGLLMIPESLALSPEATRAEVKANALVVGLNVANGLAGAGWNSTFVLQVNPTTSEYRVSILSRPGYAEEQFYRTSQGLHVINWGPYTIGR